MISNKKRKGEDGIALVAVMFTIAVLLAILSAYQVVTRIELASNVSSSQSKSGFYAAEAGLNIRAEKVRQKFVGYNKPEGSNPESNNACSEGNTGSGDYACENHLFPNSPHKSMSYIEEDPSNPLILSIPPGERYQNLNAQEYRYTVISKGLGPSNQLESVLELRFKSRLVPLFQFAAFYNKDLEILPGALMTLRGPVHTNGDLYLNTQNTLNIDGQVTSAGNLYRGRKNNSTCNSNNVRIKDPTNYRTLVNPCSTRRMINANELDPWNGMIDVNVPAVDVPQPDILLPHIDSIYWNKADLRITLRLKADNTVDDSFSPTGIEVQDLNGNPIITATNTLNSAACQGSIGETSYGANDGTVVDTTNSFYNNREAMFIRLLEIDMQGIFDCLQNNAFLGLGKTLADTTEGGLVFFFNISGPNQNLPASGYGVRVKNASSLASTVGGAPQIKGLTLVTNQAAYIQGHFNAVNKRPAAVLADAFNVLSNNWGTNDGKSTQNISDRPASHTTINTAVLAGTSTTGNVEGPGGQGGAYNGGLENYPRMHESWSRRTLTYYGSFVSLGKSLHSNGNWVFGNPQYNAPNRDWHYDLAFNDAANLPPLTPRFVYLRQQLFHRDFENFQD